jgi:alpha-L-arabinofuranosidase
LSAGTSPLYVLFTPTDSTDYASVVKTVNLTVDSSAAVVTWATPATISFGTALSATQLDATASLPGTFAYTPALGTTPAVGTDTLSVTFTPTATPSATVTKTVSLTVTKATPTVTWATPAAITAGTALTAAQLNATASVPGTLLYTPAAGAVPAAGTDTLSVTFTPTNTTGYTTVTKTVSLTVNSTSGSTSASTTNIAISSTVLQTGVTHLGMNIDKEDYYDSGQMLRNLTVRNPGFEGELRQTILNCAAVTATSCTDTNQYSTWPANFVQGAQFNFIYGAAAGQTGTVTSSTVAVQSASQGITINFPALAKPPAVGDYVIVKLTIPGNGSQGWWTTTSGGATITSESTDLSPDTPGKQALQITAAGSGQSANVTAYFDSTPGHSFVQLKGTYQITFRAKGTGGSNQLIVSMLRQGGATFFNQTVSLTSAWQNYTYSFTANETGSSIGTAGLGFQINGADVLLDDVSVAPATATAANPTPFRDEVVSTLTALHPGVLRYMDSTTYGSTIANLLAVPFARQLSSWATGSAVPEDMALGLHEFLQLCQTVGAVPYYNMPAGITPTEVQNLMEYLGGPSTSTYGAIRAARGQAAPWTTVFPIIHLELGNELWNNGTFAGAAIPGYAASSNEVTTIFGAAKSSPYYSSSNFDFVMGSWFSVPWWTQQEVALASNYDSVSVSPYLYGSLNDTSSNEAIFGPMFAEPESLDSVSTGLMVQQVEAVSAVGKKTVVYEVNMGTESGSATQAQVNSVVPSVSAGITLAEHLLLMIRDLGITTMNVWALPEYENAFINSANGSETTPLFGTVVDMGGSTNLRRPTFIGQQLANSAILPTVVQTTISGANPTWTQPLSTNGNIQLNNAHEIQSIAFSDGASSRSVVVFNLSRTQALPVTFSGPNAPTGTVTLSQLTSANLTDTNETADVVNTTSSTLSNFQPATSYSLPPFSMTVFSWQVGQ